MAFDLGRLRTDAPPPGRRPGSQAPASPPPSTPVTPPAAAPAAAGRPPISPQQQAARENALGFAQRHSEIRDTKAEKVRPWEEANPGKRSLYGPAPRPGEPGYQEWREKQEQIQAIGDVLAGTGSSPALNDDFRKQWHYGATNALVQHLIDKGVGGFARVNVGTAEAPLWRGIPTSRGNDPASAIDAAFKSQQLGALGLDTPEARLQRIAADTGIEYTDFNDLQQKVYAAVELGGGAGQVVHQNMTELMARMVADAGPRVAAAGGEDEAFFRSVFGPAGATRLPDGGIPQGTEGNKRQSSGAVPTDTSAVAKEEEQKNALMRLLDAEVAGGVANKWYVGGGGATAGLALAAYLASSGGQQQSPGAYQDQQILANSYGSY